MISSINSNVSSLQLLRAQNAFAQARKTPEVQEQAPLQEEIVEEINNSNEFVAEVSMPAFINIKLRKI